MSRWSYGDWAMAAVVIEDNGNIYPLSQLASRRGLQVNGYYEERGWMASQYYRLDDLAGQIYSRYEGSFTIHAHLRVTDRNGNTKNLHAECDGYTCCGEDCYMLLIVNPGRDAASTTLEFQAVDKSELKEAVGASRFSAWAEKSTLVRMDNPPFPPIK